MQADAYSAVDASVKRMKKIETAQSSYCLRKTPLGPVAVLWSVSRDQPKILRVLLPKSEGSVKQLVKTSFPDFVSSSCAEVDIVADQIVAFLTGNDIYFSLDITRMDLCSKFQQKVLRAEHRIPRGCVSTYQRIARYLGNANTVRAVGTALANNPFPIIIPCHRVIRSDGTLGGYQGGVEMKRALLEMEDVLFNTFGRVVIGEFFY